MEVGEWVGVVTLAVTVIGGLGWIFLFLSSKIDAAEKGSKEYTAGLVDDMWDKAEKHFATKADLGRLEGKIDAILVHIKYLAERTRKKDD